MSRENTASNIEHYGQSDVEKPLAIDLFCGLGGWSEGLIAENWRCIGFDIERHQYGDMAYPAQLVVQDVLTLDGAQFKGADLIVASPPCQVYSYMAMPWTRAKQIARGLRGEGDFPEGYRGSRTLDKLNRLFNACFRIQDEACKAAGRHIPMVVENVRGAQPWVGRARWNFGSFYLWGDVPALMPPVVSAQKFNPDGTNHGQGSWFAVADSKNRGAHKNPGFRFDGSGRSFQSESVNRAGVKQPGIGGKRNNGKGDAWFQDGAAQHGSRSPARKAASAMIAKIPAELAAHVARVYAP